MTQQKIRPEAVERERGPLPENATEKQQAKRFRLAQIAKLIRLDLPPEQGW
jgi:hypothetical protein